MIEVIVPRRTEIDTSSTARTPPNRFETAVAARSSSSAGFSNAAPPKEFGRHMRQRYGWHDADAIKRMQPVTWLTGFSLGRGSALLPLIGRRGTIAAEQPRGPGDERRRCRQFAGDLADRISRQRQDDAAAPCAGRPVLFRYGGHRQRGRRDPNRSLPRRFRRGRCPRAAGWLPVLHGARGYCAETAQPERAA